MRGVVLGMGKLENVEVYSFFRCLICGWRFLEGIYRDLSRFFFLGVTGLMYSFSWMWVLGNLS